MCKIPEPTTAEYIVVRQLGRNVDYLVSLNDDWGTVCGGLKSRALRFTSRTAASAAARKARRACMGWNGRNRVRARIMFKAVEL